MWVWEYIIKGLEENFIGTYLPKIPDLVKGLKQIEILRISIGIVLENYEQPRARRWVA